MVQKDNELAIVPVTGGSVPDIFRPNTILMAISSVNPGVNTLALDILRENPTTALKVADLAYQNPFLIERDQREIHGSVTLDLVRQTFPGIIESMTDDIVRTDILSAFPRLQMRVEESLGQLAQIGESDIQVIDLVLSTLMEDGKAAGKTIEDYYKVVDSHTAYGALADKVFSQYRGRLSRTEEYAFINIGQSLLRTRLMFEATEPTYDVARASVKPHENREFDYKGRIARLLATERLIRLLASSGESFEVLIALRESAGAEIGNLFSLYPDKAEDFKKLAGQVEGAIKLARWLEVPGAADMTKAEEISFLNADGG